jgi:cellulose synthase/poly-beta-1,6-N-acetylglucosamine synthase-like glycosyltransferase
METGISIYTVILISAISLYLALIFAMTLGWLKTAYFFYNLEQPATKVSVIVAARNEAENLPRLFHSLKKQNYPGELTEIVLVDDHSTDQTYLLFETFSQEKDNVVCLKSKGEGKKAALKTALEKASGDLILTTDADCSMGKSWIRSMATFFEKEKPEIILGTVVYKEEKNLLQKFFSLEFLSLVASGAGSSGLNLPFSGNAANMGLSKRVINDKKLSLGEKFSSGDDIFLIHSTAKKYGSGSVKFLKDRKSIVSTLPPANLKEFINQRIRWGSKAKGYKMFWALFTATTVLFFNAVTVATFVSGIIHPAIFIIYLLLVIIKFLTDYPLLNGFAMFVKKKELLKYLLFFEFIYPFYLFYTALFSLFAKYSWKGRENLR